MNMNVLEVIALINLLFTALTYLENHNKKDK